MGQQRWLSSRAGVAGFLALAVGATGAVATGVPASGVLLNTPPTAAADATPNPAHAGDTVSLLGDGSTDEQTATADLQYAWDFGDGTTATTSSSDHIAVDHQYVDAGVYTAVLTVTDPDGASDTDEVVIEVDDTAPVADATATPSSAMVAEEVVFDASSTVDAESSNDLLTFDWAFGDGATGQGEVVGHAYAAVGDYTVELVVTDPQGASDTFTLSVSVTNTAPDATPATVAPASPTAGETITFDGSGATDTETPSDLSYVWTFGDGSPSANEAVTTYTYASSGIYTAKLEVTDPQGLSDTKSFMLTVGANQKPTAALSASQTMANSGQTVSFDASGSSDRETAFEDLQFDWDFGDGTDTSTLTGATADHAFAADGEYVVSLTVTDEHAKSSTASVTVTVGNEAPAASGEVTPQPAYALQVVTFDGSASTDAETPDELTYSWTFGDGTAATPFAAEPVATHSYAAAGNYTATLRVEDALGARSTQTYAVEVLANAAPVADAEATPSPARPDEQVTFDGSGSSDPDADELTYFWNLPDGSTSTEPVATMAFAAVDSYVAELTVTDVHGVSNTTSVEVQVVNDAPTAAATATPTPAHVGEAVTFDGAGSADADGDDLTYLWEFPDGSTATGAVVTRAFDTEGSREVILTVTDPYGPSDSAVVALQVVNDAPTARFRRGGGFPLKRKDLTFDAGRSSDTESPDGLAYAWDFGDGSVAEGAAVEHAFRRPGSYRVELTVTDPQGATATRVRTVHVARQLTCEHRRVRRSRHWQLVNPSVGRGGAHCENMVSARGRIKVYAEGDRAGLIFGKVNGGGRAVVRIDGERVGVIRFGSKSDTMRLKRRVFRNLGPGEHKIVVKMRRGTGYVDDLLVYGPLR